MENLALTSARTQMYWERPRISSCASLLLKCCYICVQVSIFRALSNSCQIHNRESPLGQTSCEYSIYRQNLGRSGNSEIPDPLGFSRRMKTRLNATTWLWRWLPHRLSKRQSLNNDSPSQDSNHPDDFFQSRYVTPWFKPFRYLRSTTVFRFDVLYFDVIH